MPQHHDRSCAEPGRPELDAPDLGRRDDVAGNPDHKQVAKALVEDNLCWHTRVGASENDGEWLLTGRQLVGRRIWAVNVSWRRTPDAKRRFPSRKRPNASCAAVIVLTRMPRCVPAAWKKSSSCRPSCVCKLVRRHIYRQIDSSVMIVPFFLYRVIHVELDGEHVRSVVIRRLSCYPQTAARVELLNLRENSRCDRKVDGKGAEVCAASADNSAPGGLDPSARHAVLPTRNTPHASRR